MLDRCRDEGTSPWRRSPGRGLVLSVAKIAQLVVVTR